MLKIRKPPPRNPPHRGLSNNIKIVTQFIQVFNFDFVNFFSKLFNVQ